MIEYINTPIAKVIISALLGAIIGYTRKQQHIGSRTFSLICLGSTIFALVSISPLFGGDVDSKRIIAQIVSGVGFLGVGVIWKSKGELHGLTTAATIWTTAGLGILTALGNWDLLAVSFVLVCIILERKHIQIKRQD